MPLYLATVEVTLGRDVGCHSRTCIVTLTRARSVQPAPPTHTQACLALRYPPSAHSGQPMSTRGRQQWPGTSAAPSFAESDFLNALAEKRQETARPKTPMVYLGGETVPERVRAQPPGIWAAPSVAAKKLSLPTWGGSSVAIEKELESWFNKYDVNHDGSLDVGEVQAMLQGMIDAGKATAALTPSSMATLMDALDLDRSGLINFDEFANAWRSWLGRAMSPVRCMLTIDMQNDFISGTMAVSGGEACVPLINRLREEGFFDVFAYSLDWHPHDHCSFHESFHLPPHQRPSSLYPVLSPEEEKLAAEGAPYTPVTLTAPTGNRMEQMLWPRHCVQGSFGAANHPGLVTRASDVEVHKGVNPQVDSYSAFFDNMKLNDTGLLGKLRALGVTHVYCVGIAFDYCVAASALHAAEEGLCVTVIEDACASVGKESAAHRKSAMIEAGITVCTSAELPELMKRDTLGEVVNAARSVANAHKQSRLLQHGAARHK